VGCLNSGLIRPGSVGLEIGYGAIQRES